MNIASLGNFKWWNIASLIDHYEFLELHLYVLKCGSIMSFPKFSTWKVVSHREKAAIYIPSGKRFPIETSIFLWFSYGFPMVFPLKPPFSYGFPMVFLWFSHWNLHFPMVFLWFSYSFPMVFPLKPPFLLTFPRPGHLANFGSRPNAPGALALRDRGRAIGGVQC